MGGLTLIALRCLGPPQNIGERAGGRGGNSEVAGVLRGGADSEVVGGVEGGVLRGGC